MKRFWVMALIIIKLRRFVGFSHRANTIANVSVLAVEACGSFTITINAKNNISIKIITYPLVNSMVVSRSIKTKRYTYLLYT